MSGDKNDREFLIVGGDSAWCVLCRCIRAVIGVIGVIGVIEVIGNFLIWKVFRAWCKGGAKVV